MPRPNVFEVEFDHSSERDGYRWRGARLGKAVGGSQIGACVYELPDGERTYPYHFHNAMEEWLVVLDGTPTLRDPDGEHVLEPGDLVCFPSGPEGAHKISNQASGVALVAMLSTKAKTAVAVYPDSDKVGIFGAGDDGVLFRRGSAVGYWDGEA